MARIESLASEVARADTTTVFTGAGISTESGVPDFRSEGGVWEQYDPEQFHIRRFHASPTAFWTDWIDLFDEVFAGSFEPNPAHDAIADLVAEGHVDTVVTQNADGLHLAAGTPAGDVIELHGTTRNVVCQGCRRRVDAEPVRERARDGEIPPRCRECDGVLKPGGVLFGEQLPEHAYLSAHVAAEQSDVFLVVGSSLTVDPAASLPETAVERGATLSIVNLEPTPLAGLAEYTIREAAGTVLPAVRDAILA